jgi:hypothetical protein
MHVIEAMRGNSKLQTSQIELIVLGESKKETVREQTYR